VNEHLFMPTIPLSNIDSVILSGAAAGTADGDGIIGVAEPQVVGEVALPLAPNLDHDLTGEDRTIAFSNYSQYGVANLIDDRSHHAGHDGPRR
jgi:hypothetical protein